jgi:hypothetical protein
VEVEDVEGMCPCIFFLYGGTSKRRNSSRGSLPELRILPVCVRLVLSIIPVVEGEVIVVLDWPEDFIESGLVAPYT